MICSFIKFGAPAMRKQVPGSAKKDRIYEEKWLLEILQDRKKRNLSNILVLEEIQTKDDVPKIVGEVTQILIQNDWGFADINFTDKRAEGLIAGGKRLVRPLMIAEFDELGDIMGIRELRYLYLTNPDECSWPGE